MADTVTIYTEYVAPSQAGMRGVAIQVIELVDSYMIWMGGTELPPEEVGKAIGQGRLCKEWACGVPGTVGTGLFGGEIAAGMAQRLARMAGKVVYVSADVSREESRAAEGVVRRRVANRTQ